MRTGGGGEFGKKEGTRTSKDDAKVARRHQIRVVVFLNPASEDHTSAKARQIKNKKIVWWVGATNRCR